MVNHGKEHHVQLYGADENALAANVGRFLADGLERGDGLIVIASAAHCEAFAREMKNQHAPLEQALSDSRVLFLNAQVTLDSFMVDGEPDQARFERAVVPVIRQIQRQAGKDRITGYGEMVGILWARGQQAAAVQLEQCWNRLLEELSMNLCCAYPIDLFSMDAHPDHMHSVLCAHTHVMPVNQGLESAVGRAMDEVLGARAASVKLHIKTNLRPEWATMPTGEAMILWLRTNLDASADEILDRARRYYQATAA